jgi:hypothetical protein
MQTRALLLASLLLTIAGCHNPRYTVGLRNSTADALHEVEFRWDARGEQRQLGAPALPPAAEVRYPQSTRLPRQGELTWRNSSGEARRQAIDLTRFLWDLPRQDGTLYLDFTVRGIAPAFVPDQR